MNTLTEQQRERILALLRAGKTLRKIEDETGHRRETIAAYGRRFGVLPGDVTSLDERRAAEPACEPHRARIEDALARGRSLRDVHADLVERDGFAGSYSALKRYVRTRRMRGSEISMLAA